MTYSVKCVPIADCCAAAHLSFFWSNPDPYVWTEKELNRIEDQVIKFMKNDYRDRSFFTAYLNDIENRSLSDLFIKIGFKQVGSRRNPNSNRIVYLYLYVKPLKT